MHLCCSLSQLACKHHHRFEVGDRLQSLFNSSEHKLVTMQQMVGCWSRLKRVPMVLGLVILTIFVVVLSPTAFFTIPTFFSVQLAPLRYPVSRLGPPVPMKPTSLC